MSLTSGLAWCLAGGAAWIVGRRLVMLRSNDPQAWESEIRRLESRDRRLGYSPGSIVFAGSSSIRFWRTLDRDMAPYRVVNVGFGGSRLHQVAEAVPRLVLPHQPRGVVVYAGENDLAGTLYSPRCTPNDVRQAFEAFCEPIERAFPAAPIVFLSIKLAPTRQGVWGEMRLANSLVEEACLASPQRRFLDVQSALLDAAGNPRRECYAWDGIHLSPRGYEAWTEVVRPALQDLMGPASGSDTEPNREPTA